METHRKEWNPDNNNNNESFEEKKTDNGMQICYIKYQTEI